MVVKVMNSETRGEKGKRIYQDQLVPTSFQGLQNKTVINKLHLKISIKS